MTGAIGFWLVWYALFLVLLAAISSTTLDRVAVVDRLVGALVSTAGAACWCRAWSGSWCSRRLAA